MFASKSIAEHLARGVVGIAAFAYAASRMETSPWLSLALAAVALVALRGCPMCWTMGLVQTVIARLQGRDAKDACLDGSCARRDR
jgi:alkylhydroperoxidase family enzyme